MSKPSTIAAGAIGAATVPLRWACVRLRAVDSPVMIRDLRGRMRTDRAFWAIFAYVCGLSLAAVLFFGLRVQQAAAGIHGVSHVTYYSQLGRELFTTLVVMQLALVALFAPALTCGSISSEWERRTLEMLALTTIPSRTIVLGKYSAALCYVGLLLLCSLPIVALPLMLGGVSPVEIAAVYLITAVAGLFLAALGLLASALVKRTYAATALAYGMAAGVAFGLPLAASDPISLVMVGGLTLAGLITVFARWWLPRSRRGWRPARATYIAIFGLSYCAMVAVLNLPGFYDAASAFLTSLYAYANPYENILRLLAGPQGHYGASPITVAVLLLIYLGLAISGTIGALLAVLSLFRAVRAPQPDTIQAQDRLARELRSGPLPREGAA